MKAAGPTETWLLIKRLAVIEIAYMGFFVLPLIIAAWSVSGGRSATCQRTAFAC